MKTYEEVAKEVLRRRDEEAARRAKRRVHTRAVCCVAAGLCAVALTGVGLWRAGLFAGDRQRWPVREVAGPSTGNGEIAVIPKWEEMSIEDHFQHYISQGLDRKEAMKRTAKDRGVQKREIYNYLEKLKEKN